MPPENSPRDAGLSIVAAPDGIRQWVQTHGPRASPPSKGLRAMPNRPTIERSASRRNPLSGAKRDGLWIWSPILDEDTPRCPLVVVVNEGVTTPATTQGPRYAEGLPQAAHLGRGTICERCPDSTPTWTRSDASRRRLYRRPQDPQGLARSRGPPELGPRRLHSTARPAPVHRSRAPYEDVGPAWRRPCH